MFDRIAETKEHDPIFKLSSTVGYEE